jgi:hypothetical protein
VHRPFSIVKQQVLELHKSWLEEAANVAIERTE